MDETEGEGIGYFSSFKKEAVSRIAMVVGAKAGSEEEGEARPPRPPPEAAGKREQDRWSRNLQEKARRRGRKQHKEEVNTHMEVCGESGATVMETEERCHRQGRGGGLAVLATSTAHRAACTSWPTLPPHCEINTLHAAPLCPP